MTTPRSTAALLLFRESLQTQELLRQRVPGLRALWWSGEPLQLASLFEGFHVGRLFVEEGLQDALHDTLGQNLSAPLEVVPRAARATLDDERQVCVFPSNDTHAFLFAGLAQHHKDLSFVVAPEKVEGARETLLQLGIEASSLRKALRTRRQYSALLVGNDWGTPEQIAVSRFRGAGLPSVCLQESVIDFRGPERRMHWVDYPFVQGIPSFHELGADVAFLTGNPRYEALVPTPINSERALINCNFTYGVFEEERDGWVKAVVEATQRAGLDYLISQHPRDRADLSAYKVAASGADKVHDMLRQSSVLITRFSSLIHESLCLGRPVIYFNPHGEVLGYDMEPDGENLYVARSKEELHAALERCRPSLRPPPEVNLGLQTYVNRHCGCLDGGASRRVAAALHLVSGASGRSPQLRWSHRARLYTWLLTVHAHRLLGRRWP